MIRTSLYDFFTGRCLRRVNTNSPELYLTFDDGPDSIVTPKVLELLKKYKAQGTFFQIANRALENTDLCQKILAEGHTIGNHTHDHDTSHYFKDKKHLEQWVHDSNKIFKEKLEIDCVGFRSPLGIKTPALNKALKENKIPLVLWDTRFYDTKYPLTKTKIDKALKNLKNGSIILLHDVQKEHLLQDFLKYLEYFLDQASQNGFSFKALTSSIIEKSFKDKYETK